MTEENKTNSFTLSFSPEVGEAIMVCVKNIKSCEDMLNDIKIKLNNNGKQLADLINIASSAKDSATTRDS